MLLKKYILDVSNSNVISQISYTNKILCVLCGSFVFNKRKVFSVPLCLCGEILFSFNCQIGFNLLQIKQTPVAKAPRASV